MSFRFCRRALLLTGLAIAVPVILWTVLPSVETAGMQPYLSVSAQEPDTFAQYLPERTWIGPDGQELPFKNDAEILDFLSSAEILEIDKIPEGVTKPRKVLLGKDGVRMNAIFRDVDEFRRRWKSQEGLKLNFYDSHKSECASYRLGCLLGLKNIPPVVQRKIKGKEGTLQAWLENAMTEKTRTEEGIKPPNQIRWSNQYQVLLLFDNLIYNADRNQGNILFDQDWKMWFIDATRAFQPKSELKGPKLIQKCERTVWERLQTLEDDLIEDCLDEYLESGQIKALLKRRELLVEYIRELIETKGEQNVLFQLTGS